MGPLHGVKVVEIASIGPGPFAAMMLADMGADVVRLERAGAEAGLGSGSWNYMHRGRPSVACDLKSPAGRDLALRLCTSADALIEGFRPGVMERLGLGPEDVAERNPKLVYGRMTGYGQEGPMSAVAGHDVNYVALSGALGAIAREGERPLFPLNLVGDFGGGGMVLALGVLAAVIEARESGRGQVVDASMVEGASVLMTLMHAMREIGMWSDQPGTNLLDSGAHFYEVYECSDGGHIAVGALEPQFYAALLGLLDLDPAEFPQMDRSRWPELKERFAAVFRTQDPGRVGRDPRARGGLRDARPRHGGGAGASRTTPPAAASSRSAASSSPARRRGSAARPRPCRRHRPSPAPTPRRRSRPGG